MIKIAILSDSHKKTTLTKEAIDMLKDKGATYLIHAGDLEIKKNLDILKESGLVYTSVYGNNDYNLTQYHSLYNINKEPYYFKIKDYKFKLMHLPFYMSGDTDIVISGHTHYFDQSYINGTLFINPGEICARNKPLTECVLLTITKDKYTIEYNFKKPDEKVWKTKIFEYKII
ncbi:MAG: YfcE family phosphodiesterase [Campylobacterota bacterium]|nr:YfcE family phosphodiesterase [Campylobacterota bacterium]